MSGIKELTEMFTDVVGCCLHEPQWTPADVDKIITWKGDHETGSESSATVIVRLTAPRGTSAEYGLFMESEDYTGHGCRCSSMSVREPTLAKLLMHLEDYEIAELISHD